MTKTMELFLKMRDTGVAVTLENLDQMYRDEWKRQMADLHHLWIDRIHVHKQSLDQLTGEGGYRQAVREFEICRAAMNI